MIKSISIAALALAMTAGVASAQSTTDLQQGAGLFDQGGAFGPRDTATNSYQAKDGLDFGSTASIGTGMSDMDNNAVTYEGRSQTGNTTVPSGSTFGGSSVLFDNSK